MLRALVEPALGALAPPPCRSPTPGMPIILVFAREGDPTDQLPLAGNSIKDRMHVLHKYLRNHCKHLIIVGVLVHVWEMLCFSPSIMAHMMFIMDPSGRFIKPWHPYPAALLASMMLNITCLRSSPPCKNTMMIMLLPRGRCNEMPRQLSL